MAIYTKKWSGSAWVNVPFKRWNGGSWVDAYVKKWNGSNWIQLYPDTIITTTQTIYGTTPTWTYRALTYKSWKQEDAKQGNGSSAGGDAHNYGFLNMQSNSFPGYGSINSVSNGYYTGKRGGAGSYNSNQTLSFYRYGIKGGGASPVGAGAGKFTSTTGSPGSGNMMYDRPIASAELGNCLSWMNGVDGKSELYLSTSSAADYLSVTGASQFKATYSYMAKVATFVGADVPAIMNRLFLEDMDKTEVYHSLLIYPGEENMTLNQIIEHREANNLPDINPSEINTDYETKIVLKGTNLLENAFEIKLGYLNENHIPEYSIDNINYSNMTSPEPDKYVCDLTSEFDKNRDYIYVRVVNKTRDCVDYEYIQEPLFLIP